jgi:hypothetical protein
MDMEASSLGTAGLRSNLLYCCALSPILVKHLVWKESDTAAC